MLLIFVFLVKNVSLKNAGLLEIEEESVKVLTGTSFFVFVSILLCFPTVIAANAIWEIHSSHTILVRSL